MFSTHPGKIAAETSEKLNANPVRVMLVLDVDHTLFEVKFADSDDKKSLLSRSAQDCFFNEKFENICLVKDSDDASVSAICKEDWAALFNEIIALNEQYHTSYPHDTVPLVSVKIMTCALYTPSEFKDNLFTPVFGKVVTDALFPGSFRQHYFNDTDRCLAITKNKAEYLNKLFVGNNAWSMAENKIVFRGGWQVTMPGLARENICLVDNELQNCDEMQDHQFSAILYPSTPHSRPSSIRFANERALVFSKLRELIVKARDSVTALNSNLTVKF